MNDIMRIQLMVLTVVSILKCARDGAAWSVADYDPSLHGNTGVIHPTIAETRAVIEEVGLLNLYIGQNSTLSICN